MKFLYTNMYQKLRYTFVVCLLLTGVIANAQITLQSPYSKFGVGNIKGSLLPQLRAMGGVSTAVNKVNFFNNINMQNPASYASINLTTLDIGMAAGFTELSNSTQKENSFNSTLSHVALAFPVTTKSALSFGIMPYSELGYNFINSTKVGTTTDNTKNVDYRYTGEGGLTKAYLGYGIQFGDHFRIGANAEYLFGDLLENRSTEYVNEPGAINSRLQAKNSVGGIGFSYGAQYDISLDSKTTIMLGYSGSSSSKINSKRSQVVTQYYNDSQGNEQTAIDTLVFVENAPTNLKMPLIHNFGISIQKNNKWLFGADYRIGKWSNLTIDKVNQGLQDTYGFSVGGQITPDITAINGYFKRVDYRFGFQYDKTYIQMAGQDIKQMAVTVGLGLPLSSFGRTLYKMNFSAELGKRGTISNGLLQEKYINFHLGFTLNDKWFSRFRFD
ncbi:outer membrane protein transport protein [Pedobacter sp. ASV12]|uniref:outer membrane protein transport protein n=1 Tax=Pedobacter sp. ASV12 TaxID=2795120 RepID=UPI001E37C3C9|nr:outer membrane protein transport protein [Pedobacter sp. ASV12]